MMNVVRPSIRRSIAWRISPSVSVSTDEVASSRIRMRGSFNNVRAMATRCFCPPERVIPFSPTSVLYPSGNDVTTSWMAAIRAAVTISSSETSRPTP